MECLYCGRRLSLVQRVKKVEHCSLEHRKYWEQEQAAMYMARLDDNLMALQAILQRSNASHAESAVP